MNGYEVFCIYMSLKLHFTSPYDYFKYDGKSSRATSIASFDKRKDKYGFHKLARKLSDEDVVPFFVSNFLIKPHSWTRDFLSPEAQKNYKEWQKRIQSLNYRFKEDFSLCHFLRDTNGITENLQPKTDGSYPVVLSLLLTKDITLESMCIIHAMTGCVNVWDKTYKNDYIYSNISFLIKKYTPFLHLNMNELKEIAKSVLTRE